MLRIVLGLLIILILVTGGYMLNDTEKSEQNENREEPTEVQAENTEDVDQKRPEAFYGIWCGAYDSQEQAELMKKQLEDHGFEASVHLTTDWDGMNSSPFHIVTAGEYASQDEAEQVLQQVLTYCPDAYIKYTGDWIGS